MFAGTLLLLAYASLSTALVVPRKAPPPGWRYDLLEDYNTYHIRYLALDCQDKHNTSFFTACCHPMLKDQTLEKDRAPECKPGAAASASASAAEPTSTVSTPADEDTDDDDCDDGSDDDDDSAGDDDDCDDDDDNDSSSVPVAVEPTPSITHVTQPVTTTQTHATQEPTTTVKPTTTAKPTTTEKPTTTAEPTSTSTKKNSAPTSTANSGSGGLQTFTDGFATFFTQNGVAGACGTVHQDTDLIAAIDQARYGNSGEVSSLCGKKVKITNPANSKSVTVTIVDDCPTCRNSDSIDLSVAAFEAIADKDLGIVSIAWSFV